MRKPISRVRSVTETSMIFMILMPPTTSETDAPRSAECPGFAPSPRVQSGRPPDFTKSNTTVSAFSPDAIQRASS